MKNLIIIICCFLFVNTSSQQHIKRGKHIKNITTKVISNKDSTVYKVTGKDTLYHIVKWQVIGTDSVRVHTFSKRPPKGIKL
jgi:hypothetical protein